MAEDKTLLTIGELASRTTATLLYGVTGATEGSLTVAQLLAAGGAVVGPVSSTDNAVARFDGTTGKLVQNSSVLITDDGLMKVGTQTGFDPTYPTAFYSDRATVFVGMLNPPNTGGANAPMSVRSEDNVPSQNTYGTISQAIVTHSSGSKGYALAIEGDAFSNAIGNTSKLIGVSGYAEHDGAGTVTLMASLYASGNSGGAGPITKNAGLWVEPQGSVGASNFGIYIEDQGAAVSGDYAFWYDSTGVFRIKNDGVMAYYNPSFTKYTPGATSYERVVQQWAANVLQYGLEKGADGGTLRKLQLIGAGLILGADICPTSDPGVAGQMWRSGNDVKVSTG